MNGNIEELISTLYDMIQDARAMPLAADKCILERDKALDLLDEITAMLPGELKQAKTIVESRDELVAQARREAAEIIDKAKAEAQEMVKEEPIYQEALRQCQQMAQDTQKKMDDIKAVSSSYVDDSLRQTEEAVAKALEDLRQTRSRFQALSGMNNPQPAQQVEDED